MCSDSAPVDVPRDDSVCRLPIEPYTNIYMYIEYDVSYHCAGLLLGPHPSEPSHLLATKIFARVLTRQIVSYSPQIDARASATRGSLNH